MATSLVTLSPHAAGQLAWPGGSLYSALWLRHSQYLYKATPQGLNRQTGGAAKRSWWGTLGAMLPRKQVFESGGVPLCQFV